MRTFSIVRKMALLLFALLCIGSSFAVDANEVSTRSTSALTIDPSMGYIVTGLGELKDQVAVVFTNSAAAATWQAPKNLKNVEFLAVGGGGGGGGHYKGSQTKYHQGGAGGGGGAVVTGFIKNLAPDQIVNVTVGAGGAGGSATTSATTGAGKGYNGGNSIIKVDDLTYVTAYGGGGDGGYNSKGVANGGSNSGGRGAQAAVALKSVTVVGSGAEGFVSGPVSRVNKGGSGYSTSSGYPGAGGGGAGGVGGSTSSSSYGGACGYGYVSTIIGSRVVYGAGGGGGIGKNSGVGTSVEDEARPYIEGAGVGTVNQPGSDALANQGAGGGGGSWQQKGGNGGSGVVILRFAYSEVDVPVDVAVNITTKISDKVYTGEALVSGLVDTYAYTVEEIGERINFGQQTVRVTLNDGYYWADGDTSRVKEFTWNITQEPNNWKVEPYLSHTSWPQIFASNPNFKFRAPETSFGILQAELSTNGSAPQPFSGTLPTEPGTYTLRYWVNSTANWAAKEWKVNFTIYRSEDFSGGYKVFGLGEKGDEVAVVFTNSASWTVPANINGSAQFLVVGGGGGGGADVHDDAASGGAGGGGGGVVTGEIDLTKDAAVTVTVGAGGAGGTMRTSERDGASSGNYYGASKKGGNSVLKVDGTTYVTAYGGGRDQGADKRDSSSMAVSNMREGGQGGSNAGSRGGITTEQSKAPTMGAVASVAALRNCTTYGNKGGKGCSENFYGFPAAGGGGGATEAGGDAGNNAQGWPGGKGGEGLASDITGARVVYGSGGGGASTQGESGGKGGEGAGDGGDREGSQGTSAFANQGGGGGGSSRETTYGGKGGSGIVVIRYRQFVDITAFDEDLNRVYTGDIHTISNADTYIVSGTVSAINVGEYSITITPQGCLWPDTETNEARSYTWKIVQAINEWISDASITKTTWTIGVDEVGDITPPVAKFGEVKAMISKNGGEEVEFDGTIPNESGKYVVTYYPAESTTNFTSEEMTPQSLTFKVFSLEDIPEYSILVSESNPIGANRKAVIPYEVTCEATSIKTLNLYVCYTIVGEALTKTNLVSAIEGVKGSGNCEIPDLKPGAEYQVSFFGDIEGTISQLTEPIKVVVPSAAKDLTASSTFTNNPKEFRVTGTVIPGLGTTVVKVYWALNDASQLKTNVPKQQEFSIGDIGVEFGKPVEFTVVIPYNSESDKLIWKVEVENSLITDTWGEQTFAGPVTEQTEKERKDESYITYSWIGEGTPNESGAHNWADIRNWEPNVNEGCLGYPGKANIYGDYIATASFSTSADVDLNGQEYYLWDECRGFKMSEGITVKIKNGTLGFQPHEDNSRMDLSLGKANSTLILENVNMPFSPKLPDEWYNLKPVANSTIILEGTKTYKWRFRVGNAGTKFKVRNGTIESRYMWNQTPGSNSEVEISNATWVVNPANPSGARESCTGLAQKKIFRDGPDRQARLMLRSSSTSGTYYDMKLVGTYDFKLSKTPYTTPYVLASLLTTSDTCTISVDVSDCSRSRLTKVPLMRFMGALNTHTKNAMAAMTNDTSKLVVKANGVDVKERVKAKLEWVESEKILYYSQSPSVGTRVIVR